MALLTLLLCVHGLPLLKRGVSVESYLREGDPNRQVYDEFRHQFGNDENVLLLIQLDLFTIMIGSIAIGVAVDDTIHFMHNYRRYHERYGSVPLAVRETLATTGRALLITSSALAGGFFVFLLASMKNVQAFGLITGCTIVAALLADLMLSPALVTLAERSGSRGSNVNVRSSP
jgi:predicted RND superfamily exporter protein